MRIIAFSIGFCVAFVVVFIVIDTYISPNWTVWGKFGVAAGVGVIAGGLLAYFVEELPFILGFCIGLLVTSLVLATPIGPQLFEPGNWLPILAIALGGVAGGVIGFFFRKWIIMFISAALGSLFIAYAIDCAWFKTQFTMIIPNIIAMHKIDFGNGSVIPYVLIGGVILLTVVGCIFQYTMNNRDERKKRGVQYQELK